MIVNQKQPLKKAAVSLARAWPEPRPNLKCEIFEKQKSLEKIEAFGDPAGIRTQDHLIKSEVLYQLSYRILMSIFEYRFILRRVQRYVLISNLQVLFNTFFKK